MKSRLSLLGAAAAMAAAFSLLTGCSEDDASSMNAGGSAATGTAAAPAAGLGAAAVGGGAAGTPTAAVGGSGAGMPTAAVGGGTAGMPTAAVGGGGAGGASTAAVGGGGVGGASTAGVSGSSATGGTAGGADDVPATYETLEFVINNAPCFGAGCHNDDQNPLDLRVDDQLYSRVTSHVSANCGDLPVVNPGNPAESAIVKILRGPCGETPRMPLGCVADGDGTCVPTEYVAALEQWIANGAPAP